MDADLPPNPPILDETLSRRSVLFLSTVVIVLSLFLTVGLSFMDQRGLEEPVTADSFPDLEIISLDPHSAYINTLILQLQFPQHYELLATAPSKIEVYGEKQGLMDTYPVTSALTRISLNRVMFPANIYLKLKLYYCRKTEQGLCLIKDVVFQVPIVRFRQPEDLNILYIVPLIMEKDSL